MSSDTRITADASSMREWRGLTTQANRQQWESEWVAQLGATVDVISDDPGESSATTAKSSGTLAASAHGTDAGAAGSQHTNATAAALPNGMPMESTTASKLDASGKQPARPSHELSMMGDARASLTFEPAALTVLARDASGKTFAIRGAIDSLQPASGAQSESPPPYNADSIARTRIAADSLPGLSSTAPVPKSFALWRDENTVRFAMRTREPEKANEIISALRGWLRAVGLSLRDVWINGRNHHGG